MSLRDEIQEKQYAAMKSGDAKSLAVWRLVRTAIKNEEIAKKAKSRTELRSGTGEELNDEEVQTVIARQVKQLQEALKDFAAGGRKDLVEETKKEIEILRVYLPEKISNEKLAIIIDKVIETTAASGLQDMGKVMGAVMKEVKNKADGNQVREIVAEKLKPAPL